MFLQKHEDDKESHSGFEEAEYDQLVKQKKAFIQKLISSINDVLDEIKEEEISFIEAT